MKDRATFEADIMGWCKARSIRMIECSVQHPQVRTCGWLVYTPNSIDRKKWCRAVQEMYQKYSKQKEEIHVGLVWRSLNDQKDIDFKERVYAMHVDTPRDQYHKVRQFLRILSHNKRWPLGVRFRLMNEYSQYLSETMQNRYRYLFNKHMICQSELGRTFTDSILNLDKKIDTTTLTLRDVVNNIRDIVDDRRIFATVDKKWNSGTEYVAVFRPDKNAKAYAFIKSLSTYVKHLFTEAKLDRIFTIEALEAAKIEQYDQNTQTFITQEQIDLDREIQADLDDDSFEYCNFDDNNPFEIDISENKSLVGGERLYNMNGDDDTASTFPATSSMISFSSNASVHLYDVDSCASTVTTESSRKESL